MYESLAQKLNYHFKDVTLLKTALTHRSFGGLHNERLEFLGDGVVNFVIAEQLYQQFPKATEGELSRFRASLINRNTLADLARRFELGSYVILGPGEIRSGGHERHSILSCCMEAIIGAIYLDAGYLAVRNVIADWYVDLFATLTTAADHKDPKTVLQEYLQANKRGLPIYQVIEIKGEAHQQAFTVQCQLQENGMEVALGFGTSRRRAEQSAASAMLMVLEHER